MLKRELLGRNADPIAAVIRRALEIPGGYPISKNKVDEEESSAVPPPEVKQVKKVEEDWRSQRYRTAERSGATYQDRSLSLLFELLPTIPIVQ